MPFLNFQGIPEREAGIEVGDGCGCAEGVACSGVAAPGGRADATVVGAVGSHPEFTAGVAVGNDGVHA
ncbi:hypothetical protein [Corynebacterium cystitidis]|uniref:hypothetical protein n=1 Tax=Corynebacterium cystitidis TaxID=35757 RepID=UPI0027BA13CC|nr:hypothetical protein [Corynebacterium cystitidis]